jgi:hypothetical protein
MPTRYATLALIASRNIAAVSIQSGVFTYTNRPPGGEHSHTQARHGDSASMLDGSLRASNADTASPHREDSEKSAVS